MKKPTLLLALTILTLLLIPHVRAAPSFVPGNRLVVIRIDDIQDYPQFPGFDSAEKTVLKYHIDSAVPAFLAIIASRFGSDTNLISQVKEGLDKGVFTVGVHGWHHESYSKLTLADQTSQMQYAKTRIDTVLGIQTLAFVPPYGDYNRATVDAMKKNGLTLISPAQFVQDIPKEENGVMHLPETVTTAEVDNQTDTWNPLTLDDIVKQTTESWSNYGIAIIVIHPRQFVDLTGAWAEIRWQTYLDAIAWINNNKGQIIKLDPPSPPIVNDLNPLLISVVTFSGLTSGLLIALNLSSKRSKRTGRLGLPNISPKGNKASVAAAPPSESPTAWHVTSIGKLDIMRARTPTKIVVALGIVSSILLSAMWLTSGKTYLDLGVNWIGIGAFGVGLFQGKIFYSSTISFIITFVISYCVLLERQKRNPILSAVVSALVVLSAAYIFEYVYLYLNGQALLKYLTRFNWWFNLLAGLVIGFGFKFMRINKVSIALFSMFAVSFAVWYFSGYPQLADKETPVLLYVNYTGLPVNWAYPLNAVTKLLGCLATASLLLGGAILRQGSIITPTPKLVEAKLPKLPIRERLRHFTHRLSSIADKIPGGPLAICTFCGRQLRSTDRYCDSCGRSIGSINLMGPAGA